MLLARKMAATMRFRGGQQVGGELLTANVGESLTSSASSANSRIYSFHFRTSCLASYFTSQRRSLILGAHVKEALANGEPVVALESTLITHGLPEPENLRLALELEELVRNSNVTQSQSQSHSQSHYRDHPIAATVGIVEGQLIVGLSKDELTFLADKSHSKPIKASARDIPIAQARRQSAGTTVAGTLAASYATHFINLDSSSASSESKIRVFATGGSGGVHVGVEESMDISADLQELAKTPICCVSAGFKSFLDARKSLEYLETFGCLVISLDEEQKGGDKEDGFPAFFRRSEGLASPCKVSSVSEVASILKCAFEPVLKQPEGYHYYLASKMLPANLLRGALLGVPIPAKFALDHKLEDLENERKIASEIDQRKDLQGREKTPLILERLRVASGNRTLRANLELLKNNAQVAGRLSLEYARLSSKTSSSSVLGFLDIQKQLEMHHQTAHFNKQSFSTEGERNGRRLDKVSHHHNSSSSKESDHDVAGQLEVGVVVVGCTMLDMQVAVELPEEGKNLPRHSGVTFAGQPHLTLGGVGRNLAQALEFLGHKPLFISSFAPDNLAQFALLQLGKHFTLKRLSLAQWTPTTPTTTTTTTHNNNNHNHQNSNGKKEEGETSSCFALVLMDSRAGQCEFVVANLDASQAITPAHIQRNAIQIKSSPLLVMDANLPSKSIDYLIDFCHTHRVPIFLEPTDVNALPRLLNSTNLTNRPLLCMSPNLIELIEMLNLFDKKKHSEEDQRVSSDWTLEQIEKASDRLMRLHLPKLTCLLVTLDKRGVFVALRSSLSDQNQPIEDAYLLKKVNSLGQLNEDNNQTIIRFRYFPCPSQIDTPVSASGAGDSFAAGFISGLIKGNNLAKCMSLAFKAAKLSLNDKQTIPETLRDLRSAHCQ